MRFNTNNDFLSWMILPLHALCVSPNKYSKTSTEKTEKKISLYINTITVSHLQQHKCDLQCVYLIKTALLNNTVHQGQLLPCVAVSRWC